MITWTIPVQYRWVIQESSSGSGGNGFHQRDALTLTNISAALTSLCLTPPSPLQAADGSASIITSSSKKPPPL